LNYYIVENIYELGTGFNQYFLVKEKNKKEALDKVYELHRDEELRREDFTVHTLDEFYKRENVTDGVAVIH